VGEGRGVVRRFVGLASKIETKWASATSAKGGGGLFVGSPDAGWDGVFIGFVKGGLFAGWSEGTWVSVVSKDRLGSRDGWSLERCFSLGGELSRVKPTQRVVLVKQTGVA